MSRLVSVLNTDMEDIFFDGIDIISIAFPMFMSIGIIVVIAIVFITIIANIKKNGISTHHTEPWHPYTPTELDNQVKDVKPAVTERCEYCGTVLSSNDNGCSSCGAKRRG